MGKTKEFLEDIVALVEGGKLLNVVIICWLESKFGKRVTIYSATVIASPL